MGMFDEIRVKCDLPLELPNDHRDHWFQTKDLDCSMDYYEIREDGSLWTEAYEVEDRSDPNATGLDSLVGCATRVNKRWVRFAHTGEVEFYTFAGEIGYKIGEGKQTGWLRLHADFEDGQLLSLELLEYRPA